MSQRDRDTGTQTNKEYAQKSEYNKQSIQLPLSQLEYCQTRNDTI